MKLTVVILTLLTSFTHAQENIDQYLSQHHFSFSLDNGFDSVTSGTLKQEFSNYKLILLGEGGSHYLQFYYPLRFTWIKFLNESFGLTRFFLEYGHSSDLTGNYYLQTGDTSYTPERNKIFWKKLYNYNLLQPVNKKIKCFGIDFERAYSYTKALKLITPATKPPQKIKTAIEIIKTSNDTIYDCDYQLSLNKKLKDAINGNLEEFQNYFGNAFEDLKEIIYNNGSCKDALRDRNKNMASNFLMFDNKFNNKIYYGQLGMAHTIMINKNTATFINENSKFKNKVCVINTYCYNCSTPKEQVSNWQLSKIEKNILDELLKYCDTDFTLFDFTGDNKLIKKYKSYGQYLIIAKNQN